MEDYLQHYGVLGMKWGVRRTPEQLGHRNLRKAKTANFGKWGKSPDTNLLWVTGRSGSGKSTVALNIAKPNDSIIHLDVYADEVSSGAGMHNKKFDQYLDKHVPLWREMQRKDSKELPYMSKEYWKTVDKFAKAIEDYSKEEYKKGNRVIAEGIQITDGWLFSGYDHYKGKPIVILSTGKGKSLLQEYIRDERSNPFSAVADYFSESGTTWSKAWDKELSEITETTGAKRGSKAVDEYLKKYGQRLAS